MEQTLLRQTDRRAEIRQLKIETDADETKKQVERQRSRQRDRQREKV